MTQEILKKTLSKPRSLSLSPFSLHLIRFFHLNTRITIHVLECCCQIIEAKRNLQEAFKQSRDWFRSRLAYQLMASKSYEETRLEPAILQAWARSSDTVSIYLYEKSCKLISLYRNNLHSRFNELGLALECFSQLGFHFLCDSLWLCVRVVLW